MLNQRDLESCSNVCQIWRSASDALVCSYFDIDLDRKPVRSNSKKTRAIYVIQEWTRFCRYSWKRFTKYELDFKETYKKLQNIRLTHKVSINLTILVSSESVQDALHNFLTLFGPLVVSLAFQSTNWFDVHIFYRFWLKRLPNLETLHCSNLSLIEDTPEFLNLDPYAHQYIRQKLFTPNFDPELLEYKHEKLSKIYCDGDLGDGPFLKLLEMAPNLKEIFELDFDGLEIVVRAGLGSLIKSFDRSTDPWGDQGNQLKTLFEKLVQVQPNLTCFYLVDTAGLQYETDTQYLRSLVFVTLQNSSQSLKTLFIGPTEKSEIQEIPPLKELQTVEFYPAADYLFDEKRMFFGSQEILLEKMFPNVRKICVWFHLCDVDSLEHYFPENIIIPWGAKIRVLKLKQVDSSTLPLLQKRFPSVQKLRLAVPTSEIAEVLLQLEELWPRINSLTIDLWCYNFSQYKPNVLTPVILDSAFTGLSVEIVRNLLDPSLRKNFTPDEIQGFKDGSLISQLKDLKELKLIYGLFEVAEGESVGKFTRLTSVTNEFGFQLLPQLTVTLKIRRPNKHFKGIKTALQPLFAQSNNIQIDFEYFKPETLF